MPKTIYPNEKGSKIKKRWILLIVTSILVMMEYLYLGVKCQVYENVMGIILSMIFIISMFTFYMSMHKFILDIEERVLNKANIELLKTEIDEMNNYITNHKQHSDKLFKCYHDMANHASVFYMLIENNQLEEASRYYRSLENMIMKIKMGNE